GCYCPKHKQYDYQVDSPGVETYWFEFHKLVSQSKDCSQAKQELFKIVKAFYTCKQEKDQSVSSYLLKMKSYLDTMERPGYAMPNELGDKKKPRGAKGKDKGKNKLAYAPKPKIPSSPKRDNPAKDSVCHHRKEVGHWRRYCPSYQAELKKRKNASVASTLGVFTIELYAFPNKTWVYDTGCGYALESVARILNLVPTKKVERTPYEIWHEKAPKLSYLRVWGCEAIMKRDAPKCIFVGYPKETMASESHGLLELSGSDGGLGLIQEKDTKPSENTTEKHNEVAPIEVEPQNVEVPVRRSARIPQAQDKYGFYVDVEQYELRDLNEPPNYKAALSDPEFDKWLEAMNTKMQSMKDNKVWVLVDLSPNGRTFG
nr:hypothetical protein [Tanacetum cinerariifolium]